MKISYSRTETINLGNYENIKLEIIAEDEVKHNESSAECMSRLKKFVHQSLNDELKNSREKFSTKEFITGEKLAEKTKALIKENNSEEIQTKVTNILLHQLKKLSTDEAQDIHALIKDAIKTIKNKENQNG